MFQVQFLDVLGRLMVFVAGLILATGFLGGGALVLWLLIRSVFYTKGFTEKERDGILKKMGLLTVIIIVAILGMEIIYDLVFLNGFMQGQGRPLFMNVMQGFGDFFASIPSTSIQVPPTPTRKP